jgi:S-adenosylmethionine decarboxylase proenzyme
MSIGTHYIADLYDFKNDVFKEYLSIENYHLFHDMIKISLRKNGMTLLNDMIHHFDGFDGAVTSLYLLSESHLSFHSWPEKNYLAVDIFTCGECNTKQIIDDIIDFLKPETSRIKYLNRGIPEK